MAKEKTTKTDSTKITYIVIGVLLLLAGLGLGYLWNIDKRNYLFTFGVLMTFSGSFYLFYLAFFKRSNMTGATDINVVGFESHVKDKVQHNCLNIYGKELPAGNFAVDKIEFATMENPEGMPRKCWNDGKNYFVNYFDLKSNNLVPLPFPDMQYYDPILFAKALSMPAVDKLLKGEPSLLSKLAPWIMIAGIGIAGFFLLVLGD